MPKQALKIGTGVPKEYDPSHSATSDSSSQDEEFVRIGRKNYPKRVIEAAQRVVKKTGGSLESAIQSVLVFEQAQRNAKPANPNEPVRAFSSLRGRKTHSSK